MIEPQPAQRSAKPKRTDGRPTRRGRPSHAQSVAITEAIIKVATDMFLTEGFDATTMDALALAVPVPKTTLYKRFPDKLAVLNAVLHARIATWSRKTTQQSAKLGDDLRQRLIHHTTTMLVWSTKQEVRDFTRLALSAAGRGNHGVNAEFFAYIEMIKHLRDEIETYGPGSGMSAKNPEKVAQAIMAMISGWLNIQGINRPLTKSQAREQAEFIINMLMSGSNAW